MLFSERLRMLIEESSITQKQLAGELAIPASTFGGYVQGTSEPDFQTLVVIADYFGVTTDFLLGRMEKQAESRSEDDLLRVFRSLSETQKEIYIAQGKAIMRINMKEHAASANTVNNQRNK